MYQWNVLSAPNGSVFSTNSNMSAPFNSVIPDATLLHTNTSTVNGVTNTTNVYYRTMSYDVTQINRKVQLLNHGYKYPMTSMRPDVAGTYTLQLVIDDGCSTWQSSVVTVNAMCTTFGTVAFNTVVTLYQAGSSTPVGVATTMPAVPSPLAIPAGATVYSVSIDGSQYVRLTMAADITKMTSTAGPAVSSNYFTYMWTITNLTPGLNNAAVAATNMQGEVASFVPTDTSIDATYATLVYQVQLTVATTCMQSDGSMQVVAPLTAWVVVTCSLTVTPASFQFFTPYVNTYSTSPETFFGLPNLAAGAAGSSNFANTGMTTLTQTSFNLYYRQNMMLKAASTVTNNMQPQDPVPCDPTGPYCGANPTGAVGSTMYTVLFGGSVVHGGGTAANNNGQPANGNYARFNSVWGAGWQQLYFSVPATLVPGICKIKQTYWVLSNYQNALPFAPSYVSKQQAVIAPTCNPSQDWSWTVVSTPCTPCTCANAAATCDQFGADVCDFDLYDSFTNQNLNVAVQNQLNVATTQTRLYTGYMPPTFNYYTGNGAATGVPAGLVNGNNLNAYCVYDVGMRLDSVPYVTNMRANCRVSGRGLSVDISQATTCALTAPVKNSAPAAMGGGAAVTSIKCPMSNIAFVPGFPGTYGLQLNVYDMCSAPKFTPVSVTAQCRVAPQVSVLKAAVVSYYDCADSNAGSNWGNPNSGINGIAPGKFDPIGMSTLIAATGITTSNSSTPGSNSKATSCAVAAPTTTMNCTDVMNYVNTQNVMVETSAASGNKFRACCTCLYGSQTINVFGSGTTGSHTPPTNNQPPVIAATTQSNNLALDDAEYNRNNIILIALVTPMAVLLVGSLAGNVLMVLKMRQGAAAAGGFNVRAGDVELSTSPRARVDV